MAGERCTSRCGFCGRCDADYTQRCEKCGEPADRPDHAFCADCRTPKRATAADRARHRWDLDREPSEQELDDARAMRLARREHRHV